MPPQVNRILALAPQALSLSRTLLSCIRTTVTPCDNVNSNQSRSSLIQTNSAHLHSLTHTQHCSSVRSSQDGAHGNTSCFTPLTHPQDTVRFDFEFVCFTLCANSLHSIEATEFNSPIDATATTVSIPTITRHQNSVQVCIPLVGRQARIGTHQVAFEACRVLSAAAVRTQGEDALSSVFGSIHPQPGRQVDRTARRIELALV